MTSLLRLFGYTRPIPMHDHTDSRRSLRAIEHQKSGDPLGDPTFVTHVNRVTDADQRARETERIFAARRAWGGAAALLALALATAPATAQPSETTRQLSAGQPWSEVYLPSLPQVSPDSQRVVFAQDAVTNGAQELWSVPLAGGVPVRISNALTSGQVPTFRITPDGQRVVFLTDQNTLGTPELFSVPIVGGESVRISRALVAAGHVLDFQLAPASGQAYYRADAVTNNLVELFRVPVAGGLSTRVNRTLPSTNYDVFDYAAASAAGTERVVYRSGRSDVGGHRLYSNRSDGQPSQAHEISRDLVTGGAVGDFRISPDGTRVAYLADAIDNGRMDLWSVPIAGGTSTRLDFGNGRSVRSFTIDTTGVVYAYSATEFYRVPVTGGASVPALPPMPAAVASADGQWIVYAVGSALWSSGPSGLHRRVSCIGQTVTTTFLTQPTYTITPNSRTVVYIASGELWAGPITGSVCRIFSDGFESGSVGAWR